MYRFEDAYDAVRSQTPEMGKAQSRGTPKTISRPRAPEMHGAGNRRNSALASATPERAWV